jgi:hypothetical protein
VLSPFEARKKVRAPQGDGRRKRHPCVTASPLSLEVRASNDGVDMSGLFDLFA